MIATSASNAASGLTGPRANKDNPMHRFIHQSFSPVHAIVVLAACGAFSTLAQETQHHSRISDYSFNNIITDSEVAGPIGSTEWRLVLENSIITARKAAAWTLVERLSWYGYSAYETTDSDRTNTDIGRLRVTFLSTAAEALVSQAHQGLKESTPVPTLIHQYKPSTEIIRLASLSELRKHLETNPEPDPTTSRLCVQTLSTTRLLPLLTEEHETLFQWEEDDGDTVSALPRSTQLALLPNMLADDNYFRAARSALECRPEAVEEINRLLSKIDGLAIKRKHSSFHAATLADDISLKIRPKTAYRFSIDWYRAHADEPESGYLLSRISAYAAAAAQSHNPDQAIQMLHDIQDVQK